MGPALLHPMTTRMEAAPGEHILGMQDLEQSTSGQSTDLFIGLHHKALEVATLGLVIRNQRQAGDVCQPRITAIRFKTRVNRADYVCRCHAM